MNNLGILSKNIKKLLSLTRISESELARSCSISQPIISRLAQGITTNPNVNTLRPIAKFFSISIDQLIGDKPLFKRETGILSESLIVAPNWIEIPIISWEKVNDWQNTLKEEEICGFLRIDTNLSKNAYALSIEDSTMEPTFIAGTYIIIEPKLQPLDKDFVIVLYNGQDKPILRQIFYSGNDVFFKPINQNFSTVTLTKKCKIMGVIAQMYLIVKK